MAKTIPISVRLSQEDADFITNLQIDGAITPSDKVRSIIKKAKQNTNSDINYENSLSTAVESLKDLTLKAKIAEMEEKKHSELVNVFNDWIAEAFAYIASTKQNINTRKMDLTELEEGISERVFRLFEAVARMGVTSNAPCYNKEIISKGFTPLLELTHIINQRLNKEK